MRRNVTPRLPKFERFAINYKCTPCPLSGPTERRPPDGVADGPGPYVHALGAFMRIGRTDAISACQSRCPSETRARARGHAPPRAARRGAPAQHAGRSPGESTFRKGLPSIWGAAPCLARRPCRALARGSWHCKSFEGPSDGDWRGETAAYPHDESANCPSGPAPRMGTSCRPNEEQRHPAALAGYKHYRGTDLEPSGCLQTYSYYAAATSDLPL